jgi:hypothetical protein
MLLFHYLPMSIRLNNSSIAAGVFSQPSTRTTRQKKKRSAREISKSSDKDSDGGSEYENSSTATPVKKLSKRDPRYTLSVQERATFNGRVIRILDYANEYKRYKSGVKKDFYVWVAAQEQKAVSCS